MTSLAKCLKKLKIDVKHEDVILKGLAVASREGKLSDYDAAFYAIHDAIDKNDAERADVIAQMKAQGVKVESRSETTSKMSAEEHLFGEQRDVPKSFTKPIESTKDERITNLEKHLKDNGYDFTVEPASVRDIDALDSTKKARKELAEKQAKLFKKKVVFVKADGPFRINGVMVPSIADTIFVDIRTDKAFDAIMAHELSHWMGQEKPAVYNELVKSLKTVIINEAEYAKKYGIEGATKAEITKEIVGDLMGDNFTEQSFWNKVAEANPKAFKDIAAAIIKWLKGVIVKAKANGMGSEQWVKDAVKAQDIVAKAVAQYTGDSKSAGMEGGVKFNVTGDNKSDIDKARVILNRLSDLYTRMMDQINSKSKDKSLFFEFGERAVESKDILASMLESGRLNGIGIKGKSLLSRNTSSKNPWRITFFSPIDGEPGGHNEYKSAKEALNESDLIVRSKDKDKIALFSRAYHGSPHDHDKFDASKIGTGEGAQAYGYGHYFAESKDVAEYYKKALSTKSVTIDNKIYTTDDSGMYRDIDGKLFKPNGLGEELAVRGLLYGATRTSDLNTLAEEVESFLQTRSGISARSIDAAKDFIKSGRLQIVDAGKLYEVELAPEQDEYLLWDEPLSEQSDKVKSALSEIDFPITFRDSYKAIKDAGSDPFNPKTINIGNGNQFYADLSKKLGGSKATSEYLHSLGIRGIKYLDGLSRGKGEGAYNYVIFDDKDVSITAKFSRAPKSLDAVEKSWDSKGIASAMSERNGIITLNKIVVPKDSRNAGVGTAAMRELTDYADATNQQIALTPSADFGGNKVKLQAFYKRFGFRKNNEFNVMESMIRDPASTKFSRAPKLYSKLEQAIEAASDKVFSTGPQVKLWLQSNAGKLGIKKDEIYWSGVDNWLDAQGKVSKQQVVEFVRNNGVKVDDVTLGGDKEFNTIRDKLDRMLLDELEDRPVDKDEQTALEKRLREIKNTEPKHNNDKLTLPGGSNYKELVVTVPTIEPHNADDSIHFGDTGGGRQIGWLRMNTRDGGLFIEELQSQRAQQGRSKGFSVNTKQWFIAYKNGPTLGDSFNSEQEARSELADTFGKREDLEVRPGESDRASKMVGVPPAPFVSDANQKATNAYITLLMKKALIEAVSNDHASVSWTTGDQQSERYDLSKQIGRVTYTDDKTLRAYDVNDDRIQVINQQLTDDKELVEYIGKDAAEKLLAQPARKNGKRELSGLALKTGGEWAQSMYGNEQGLNLQGKPSLISQAANDIFKHVGSGKVESINGQPGFYVTPEMKSKDLPLFSFAGPKAETADKYALDTAQQRIAAGDDADTVRQETGWFKGVDDKWRFEINDSDAKLTISKLSWGTKEDIKQRNSTGSLLSEVLDHPKLFAAYPAIKGYWVRMVPGMKGASFQKDDNIISVGYDLESNDIDLSNLLHEIQHGIQNIEGFASGGSVESARRVSADIVGAKLKEINSQIIYLGKNRSALKGDEYAKNVTLHKSLVEERKRLEDSLEGLKYDMAPAANAYKRLAGEVEARNTQSRLGMNEADRKAMAPSATQDVPDSDQIIVYNGTEMAYEPTKPTPPDETRLRRFQRMNQDSFNRFTVIKEWLAENGQTLSDKADVYGAEERYHSKAANQLEDFREQQRNPLIEKIQKAGYTLGDIEVFLKMQHAQEANAQIRKLGDNPDATAYGIEDQEATDYLTEAPENLAKLANELRDITEQTKKLRLDAGILNTDITDAWEGAYKHYVPVKGEADSTRGVGKGLKTNFKSKRRLGHSLRDEHVIENILMDHERAILEVERNRVGKHLVMMAAEMQRPDILSIDQPEKRKMLKESTAYTVEANGVVQGVFKSREEAKMFKQFYAASMPKVAPSAIVINQTKDQRVIASASPMLAENEVNVYMNGHTIRVQINDELLARAYTKMGVEQFSDIVAAGRILNGYLSKVYTGYNPEFILTNMIRDFSSGTINLTGEQGFGMAAKALTNYPRMFTDLLKYAATNGKSSTKLIDSYRANGGNTGAAYLSDMERLGNEVSTEYASHQGVISNLKQGDNANAARAAGRKVFNATLKWIYNLNQAGENAMRLAAFKAMLDSGRTVNEAAKVAKNITVNFNRKGERQWAPALYLFYNASMQGTAATGHALFKGKHKGQAWALAGSMAAVGYMMAASFGGGSEDDWDEINDYTKERNMLIKSGDGYVKVPVPYGYGFFWNLGRYMSEAQRTGDWGKMPWHLATSAMSELTPFNDVVVGSDEEFRSDQVFMGLLPTAMKIVAQPTFNKQLFTGSELMPDSPFDKSQPDRQKMFRSTKGTMYDTVAGWLDSAGIDISPETLKYTTRTFTGGAGSLVDTGISAAMLKAEGAELDTQEIPFVRKGYMELGIKDKRAAYYKVREEARTAAEEFNRARRANDTAKMQTVLKDKNELIALDRYANKLAAVIDAARDQQDAVRADEKLSVQEKRLKLKDMEAQESKFYDQYLDVFKASVKR